MTARTSTAPRAVDSPSLDEVRTKARRKTGARGHVAGCGGVLDCGGTYFCEGCKRRVGWCDGCLDDMPEHCDRCWNAAHSEAAA